MVARRSLSADPFEIILNYGETTSRPYKVIKITSK